MSNFRKCFCCNLEGWINLIDLLLQELDTKKNRSFSLHCHFITFAGSWNLHPLRGPIQHLLCFTSKTENGI